MSQPPASPMPQYGGPMSTPPSSPMPPPPPKKKRTGLIIGIIAGALFLIIAVIVVIALIIFFAVRGGSGGDTTGGGGGDKSATPEEQATTLVTDYMDALVAGDSASAFELAAESASDVEMLPAEAYDAALAAAPVADVAVGTPVIEADAPDGTVPTTFTVGGEEVSYDFTVSDYDADDSFELDAPNWSVYGADALAGLSATINGSELPTDSSTTIAMLPGSYEIAFGVDGFAPSVTDPLVYSDFESGFEWPEATLTDDGLTTFRAAVQKSVDACIAQDTLKAGCGIGELPATTDDGYTLTEGTVKRSLPEDSQRAIDKMTATPSYDEPTFVEGEYIGTIDTTMGCEKDGQKGTCEMWLGGGLGTPSVDMADPKLPVTWS